MRIKRYGRYGVGVILAIAGCITASVPPTSAKARMVEVRKGDPPPGAMELGTIEVQNGGGCGGFGAKGTFEGAVAELRNNALARGADYVMLVSQTEPHSEANCFVDGFVLRGIAYRQAPRGTDVPAPLRGPAMTSCDPPCSPGYQCSQQVCVAVCNPVCGPEQVCRQDRTCAPSQPLAPGSRPMPPPTPAQ